jgi:hypothetical protein
MGDNVVDIFAYESKKGNLNVNLSQTDHKQITEEIKKILENPNLSLKDFSYDIKNYPRSREISVDIENMEGGNMSNNEYVTEKDFKALEDRLEQKLKFNQELIVQKLDATKNEINLKFDNQLLGFKDLLNSKFNEQKEKQTANNRWLITTVIATAGVLFAALKVFLK